jgi:hypothetical protein
MLVYGDHDERADSRERLQAIAADLRRLRNMPPGLVRHSALISALIEAGRLQQGLADCGFENGDRLASAEKPMRPFVHALATAAVRSWDSGGGEIGELPPLPDLAAAPTQVTLRRPEGFAYYALYPEAFADAARALVLQAPPRVIGIRSIGTTLGAVVAAALDAPPAVTVRPFGDPWKRQVALSPELEAVLLDGPAHFIIVDEGPGLSGSSFGAVIDWLRARGVALDRIAVLPSHGGAPGPSASETHRHQWQQVQRVPADLAPRLPDLLGQWLPALLGPVDGPLVDVSGGQWRRWAFRGESEWPPVDAALERRKYVAFADGQTWLVKFAGLGGEGERKLELARRLANARLTPEPRGLLHGFLVERWLGEAVRRQPPLDAVAHYIRERARVLSDCRGTGASLCDLRAMAEQNFREAAMRVPLDDWHEARLRALEQRLRRIPGDNRMMPWEWLQGPSGEWLKSDALDHHRAHDLVGCQDIAWDVAGTAVEFGLDETRTDELRRAVERRHGPSIDRELLDFYRLAYAAFCLGQLHFAVERATSEDEKRRLADRRERLLRAVERLPAPESPANPR